MPTQFPGIKLKNELKIPGLAITILLDMSKQEVHTAKVNVEYTATPNSNTLSPVDNIIVINVDSTSGNDIVVKNSKLEETSSGDVGDASPAALRGAMVPPEST